MRRAEIWTVAGGPDYSASLAQAVIVQDDAFAGTASITLCPFTTRMVDAPLMRLPIAPTRFAPSGRAGRGTKVASPAMSTPIVRRMTWRKPLAT